MLFLAKLTDRIVSLGHVAVIGVWANAVEMAIAPVSPI